MDAFDLTLLLVAALFAGLVDSMAGGGGLIQIPALLQVLGNQSYPLVFGTNKLSSIVGTSGAAIRYAKRVTVPWNTLTPAVLAALPIHLQPDVGLRQVATLRHRHDGRHGC